MKHYAGLDVSVKETSICIVDERGKICRELNRSSDGGMAKYPTFQGDMPYGAP